MVPPITVKNRKNSGKVDQALQLCNHSTKEQVPSEEEGFGSSTSSRSKPTVTYSDDDFYSTTDSSVENKQVIDETEESNVRKTKHLIFVVVIISIISAVLIYGYTKYSERKLFHQQFRNDAEKILGSLGGSVEKALGALDSMAVSFLTIARSSNQTFPFVTIPHYGNIVAKSAPLTGAIATYLLPVVNFSQRADWEAYASGKNKYLQSWVEESLELQNHWSKFHGPMPQNKSWEYHDIIHSDFEDVPYNVSRPDRLDILLPNWHQFPLVVADNYPANWDWYDIQNTEALTLTIERRMPTLSEPLLIPRPGNLDAISKSILRCEYYKDYIPPGENCMEPLANWYYPIIDSLDQIELSKSDEYPNQTEVKAIIAVDFYWRQHIRNILPAGSKGIDLVVENTCVDDSFTYRVDGPVAKYRGVGDYHESQYDRFGIRSQTCALTSFHAMGSDYSGLTLNQENCAYFFSVYPSDEMRDQFESNNGIIFALFACSLILVPFVAFLVYDTHVRRQRAKIMSTAQRSDAIISSLFPASVVDKLYPAESAMVPTTFGTENLTACSVRRAMSNMIAELYVDTTVLFADIANFTAWSSVRDPFQVFALLESIYGAFDEIAKRRKVFKVETVGDCYVAVAGLPEPCKAHAVVMTRFAYEILNVLTSVTYDLEEVLGPGTASLTVRVGLNSGPTTAGVLRGDKGRFQLFGDTMNTAARMESNSIPGKILCTEKTKELLVAAGKSHWVTLRSDVVEAKGKGRMVCYWCNPKPEANKLVNLDTVLSSNKEEILTSSQVETIETIDHQRQVDWMTGVLGDILNVLLSTRDSSLNGSGVEKHCLDFNQPRDEVSETVVLPTNIIVADSKTDTSQISADVRMQLHHYISSISNLYNDNPFHNFDHACHVVMATKKILSRVIKPNESSASSTAYGITNDPLTQFAIIFSALIHDVEHPGVSNSQLVAEKSETAIYYHNKSVAEQNSITVAWDLLKRDQYKDLVGVIMPTESECKRFRQLVVNSVMATDLFDGELKNLRDTRWQKSFELNDLVSVEDSNRRATIIIEHIIQASDVSHTMQHWKVYQLWNRRLFLEMYTAYANGRAEKNPVDGWYGGELWFFDNYIIPLAKKLKTCGVFGVSCDELLDYANDNRAEWAEKGKLIVAELEEFAKSMISNDTSNEAQISNDTSNEAPSCESKWHLMINNTLAKELITL